MKKDQVMLVYMTTVKQSAQIVSTYIVNSLKLKPNWNVLGKLKIFARSPNIWQFPEKQYLR
jgi:hypothetical protein